MNRSLTWNAVALCAITASATAAVGRLDGAPTSLAGGGYASLAPRSFAGTGFEQAEGYGLTSLVGQQGWTGFTNQGNNETTNVAGGGNPGQSMMLTGTTQALNGPYLGGFSPIFSNASDRVMRVDVKIDDNGGANYFFSGLSVTNPQPGQPNAIVFSVAFDYRGSIYIAQDQQYINTGISWVANQWRTISVELTQTGIVYTYDGQTYSGGFANTALGASAPLEQVALYSDNYQLTGSGAFSGSGTPNGKFDNLALVPSPGSAGMALLASCLGMRRRR